MKSCRSPLKPMPCRRPIQPDGNLSFMRILALDTATRTCSVAIVDHQSTVAELTNTSVQTHAVHLMGMVQRVIDRSGLALPDIDGFAVGRGPGSFTGLRIGISTIKALAAAAGKPVVGVSNLDALAMQAAPASQHMICSLMDARKGEIYYSLYRCQDGNLHQIAPPRVSPLAEVLPAVDTGCVFIGEGAQRYRKEIYDKLGSYAVFAAPAQHTVRASTIGRLSLERFEKGHTDDIFKLVPEYLRKSDAELGFKRQGRLK